MKKDVPFEFDEHVKEEHTMDFMGKIN